MNCEQVTPYLPGLAGDELGAETVQWVHAHLSTCASCTAEAKRYGAVATGLATMAQREIEPPAFVVDAILDRVEAERSRRMIPIPPTVIPAELVRLAQDNREAIASTAGIAVAAVAAYALWRKMRATRFRTAT